MSVLNRVKSVFWWLPFGHVSEISATELQERILAGDPLQIIDVRSEAEWRRGHVSGARNVPIYSLKKRIGSLKLDAQKPVVAICLSAHRSIPAVRLLEAQGFADAVQLRGGMLAWWNKKFATQVAEE